MSPLFLLVAVLLAVALPNATAGTESDIVTEILRALEGVEEMGRVAEYLKSSRIELADKLPLEMFGNKMSYTFFAPTSSAFMMQTPQDTVDPFVVDDNLRLHVLLRHFAQRRVQASDFETLTSLVMADSKEAIFARTSATGDTLINDAVIQNGSIELPNVIGTVFTVNRVFVSSDEVGRAIRQYHERNPNSGFGFFG